MGLTLLHISDIHFKAYDKNMFLDMDKDIQNEIENDLHLLRPTYGDVDITMIGGDIAYSGSEQEYKKADEWISTICEISGCKEENVLTVPGNHDVQRDKLNPLIRDVHSSFKRLRKRADMDKKMEDFMKSPGSAEVLLDPFSNYTAFAQKYGSVPETQNGLYWEKKFELDNCVLRIRGVNSAIVSDDNDDEHNSKMILTTHQSNIPRDHGVINAVLCHHPPQWMYDNDETTEDFNARARIQMFGHKHNFRSDIVNDCLVLSAGAMLPSRSESGWDPRYNIIKLNISEENGKPILLIRNYRRKWHAATKQFAPDFAKDGTEFHEHKLFLSELEMAPMKKVKKLKENLKEEIMTEPIINPQILNPKRKLAYMFLSLPYHSKLTIAVELGLIDDIDRHLDEVVREQNYFMRAVERDILYELWEHVAQEVETELKNPFKKQ